MDKKKTGKFLRELRQEMSLTQSEMARQYSEFIQIPGSTAPALISKWENGECFPNIVNVKDLARFFNVTVDEIFNGEREIVEDYEKKYFICKNEWAMSYDSQSK